MEAKSLLMAKRIKLLLAAALLLAIGLGGAAPAGVVAQPLAGPVSASAAGPAGYSIRSLASLGDPAPGGGHFINDFEAWGLNNNGQASFAADMDTGGEGGFLYTKGQITPVLRTGDPAPGGGTIGVGVLGHQALNASGDTVAGWLRDPAPSPFGVNAGVYRYSHITGAVTALMLPGTPAPGGATFLGSFYHSALNNAGDAVFPGIISPTQGINGNAMGMGVFQADKAGQIIDVASPGDTVPEGTLDGTVNPWINDRGDVAFSGHVVGEECIPVFGNPPDALMCGESIYLKQAASGRITSIAHQGAAIPPQAGGGTYHYAWGAVVNNRDEVVFIGDLSTPPGICEANGIFLWRGGDTYKVVRPGDALPGGGHMLTATCVVGDYFINNNGDVSFNIVLDTSTNGVPDTGIYISSGKSTRLVARAGTEIPGVGTIATTKPPFGWGGAMLNERGQVLFQAGFTDGTQRLLLATPAP